MCSAICVPQFLPYRSLDAYILEMCPHFRGCYVQASMELMCPFRDVSSFQRVLFNGVDVSLLERCPHFSM